MSASLLLIIITIIATYSFESRIKSMQKKLESLEINLNSIKIDTTSKIAIHPIAIEETIFPMNQSIIQKENAVFGTLNLQFDSILKPSDTIIISSSGAHVLNTISKINNGLSGTVLDPWGVNYMPLHIRGGNVILNVNVYDMKRNLIVSVSNNIWLKNPRYNSKVNYDKRGFEVLDSLNNVALSINILNRGIIIQGYYVDSLHERIFILGKHLKDIIPINSTSEEIKKTYSHLDVSKLFDYSKEPWLGRRAPFSL